MRDKIELFKVLSEPNRVRILMMLLHKPLCVCEITSILELSTATVSNHLSYLRKEGFIEAEKDGKWINYRITKNIKNPLVKNILDLLPEWFANEKEIKEDLIKVKNVDRFNRSNIYGELK
jgi:ArsR family transcriptional regulator